MTKSIALLALALNLQAPTKALEPTKTVIWRAFDCGYLKAKVEDATRAAELYKLRTYAVAERCSDFKMWREK